jgi:hypothetical protein
LATRAVAAALGLTLAVIAGCIDVVAPRPPATEPGKIFDQVWLEFDRHYSLFEAKGVDWNALGQHYRPLALGGEGALFTALCSMLDTLQDLHVTLYTPRGRCGRQARRTDAYDPSAVTGASYLAGTVTTSRSLLLTYGVIGPDVGYLRVSGFTDESLIAEVDSAMRWFAHVRAVIIDLRLNGGGNTALAEAIAGRFLSEKKVYVLARFRNGPSHDDFAAPIQRSVGPAGANRFLGPVAILTNRTVGSAAEDFVMAMLTRSSVALVGDTTSGTATNPLWRDLPNGWTYRLSQSIESTPGGFAPSVAGGIPPLIVARTTPADSASGVDVPVESALSALRALSGARVDLRALPVRARRR